MCSLLRTGCEEWAMKSNLVFIKVDLKNQTILHLKNVVGYSKNVSCDHKC